MQSSQSQPLWPNGEGPKTRDCGFESHQGWYVEHVFSLFTPNLLEPLRCRGKQAYRVVSSEFGVELPASPCITVVRRDSG